MTRLYKALSTLGLIPALGATLLKNDLRSGVVSRFMPEAMPGAHERSPRIWMHAASAGEVRLAAMLSDELAKVAPGSASLLTTNTESGMTIGLGKGFDFIRRFPFDVYPSLKRLFDQFAPQLIVLIEMELWPGLLSMARERGVPVLVVNARMSAASAPRYARLNARFDDLLCYPGYLTRDDTDLDNLMQAGIRLDRLMVTGEMKVDLTNRGVPRGILPKATVPTLLCVSTHAGEESILLEAAQAIKEDYPDFRLILAPRHSRRVAAVLALAHRLGLAATPIGDSNLEDLAWADVCVEDRFGRMGDLFVQSSAAFVGGSLVDHGGHNVLEPVLYGLPVMIGPYSGNWSNWTSFLDETGAATIVKTPSDIARIFGIVIEEADEVMRILVSVRARLHQQLGTTVRNVRLIEETLAGGDPFAICD
jgi:3-deoxy-D-manno-octulosonic-acid transferase